ncbi:hypothetical protein A0257_06955 [Hymenobacter psoromatis]|nr:hypothetical protein A0257_06955 [Hymenobacter psoromatis]
MAIQQGTVPYSTGATSVKVPQTLYYKVVSGVLQFQRSLYKAAPATAPTGTTSMAWASGINPTYVANTMPAGATYTANGTTAASTGMGLAAEYVTGQGKELFPIPQSTIDTDPALKQNAGY